MSTEASVPVSRTEYVLSRLRSDLMSGKILPGEQLRQSDLANLYGVSATPVRESLRRLEAEGLVTFSAHKGATVRELDAESVKALYEIRSAVEGLATRMVTEQLSSIVTAKIASLHEEVEARIGKDQGSALSELNRAFHFAIYDAASPIISTVIRPLWAFIPASVSLWDDVAIARAFSGQHAGILAAITAGNAVRAEQLMVDHIKAVGKTRIADLCA